MARYELTKIAFASDHRFASRNGEYVIRDTQNGEVSGPFPGLEFGEYYVKSINFAWDTSTFVPEKQALVSHPRQRAGQGFSKDWFYINDLAPVN